MWSYVITRLSGGARVDAAGVLLSALCGVHCVAMPLLAASGLLLGSGSADDYTHYALFATAAPVTLLAAWRVLRHRHSRWLLPLAGVGLLALWLGLSRDSHDLAATSATLSGALLLAGFHLYHWRLHRTGGAHAQPR